MCCHDSTCDMGSRCSFGFQSSWGGGVDPGAPPQTGCLNGGQGTGSFTFQSSVSPVPHKPRYCELGRSTGDRLACKKRRRGGSQNYDRRCYKEPVLAQPGEGVGEEGCLKPVHSGLMAPGK